MTLALDIVRDNKAYARRTDATQTGLNPLTGDCSFSIFFRMTSFTASAIYCLARKGNTNQVGGGYSIYSNSAGGFRFELGDYTSGAGVVTTTIGNGAIALNQWYNLLVTFDRDSVATLYLNGVSIGTVSISTWQGSIASTQDFTIGATTGGTNVFAGQLCYARWWSKVLTAGEIARQSNMSDGTPYARPYAQLSISERLGLVSAWDEPPTTFDAAHPFEDLHGTNDLTFVTADAGITSIGTTSGPEETTPPVLSLTPNECICNVYTETMTGGLRLTGDGNDTSTRLTGGLVLTGSVLTKTLEAHWPLCDLDYTEIISGLDGSSTIDPVLDEGLNCLASLRFGSVSRNYISVPATEPQTVSLWAKIDSIAQHRSLFSTEIFEVGHSYLNHLWARLLTSNDGETEENEVFSGNTLDQDRWYHLAITYDGLALRAFVNGVESGSSSVIGAPLPRSGSGAYLGRNQVGGIFDGNLQDVRVYEDCKNSDWLRAEYSNYCDPRFLLYGDEQSPNVFRATA